MANLGHCASVKRIYVAAPLRQSAMAQRVADALETDGHSNVSTWHLYAMTSGVTEDPRNEARRQGLLLADLAEVASCDILVALMHIGTPRATIGEIGYALCLGKPVLWVHGTAGEGCNLFDAHPLVTRIAARNEGGHGVNVWLERETIADVLSAVRRMR